jgi:hypothetical protein
MSTKPQIWADPNYDPANDPLMQAGAKASPFVAPAADAAPSLARISMPGAPPVFAPGPAPMVTKEPTPIETQIGETSGRLQKLQQHDTYDYGDHSKLRNIGHVFSKIGNIAGDIFAPATMANLPGTDLNRQVEEGSLSSRLQSLTRQQAEDEASGAQTAKAKLETQELPQKAEDESALSEAQTGNLKSEAYARAHPLPDYELHDTPDGILKVNKKDGSAQFVTVDGKQIGTPIKTTKVQLKIGGVPHEVLVNEQTGMPIKDLGESGFKPQNINVNAGEAALDREAKMFGATHQKSLDASNAQLEKIADARNEINGSSEAQATGIPKVLTALVSGAGSGVRITQAEINAIGHARGIAGDVEGTLNRWSGKGVLTSQQQKQLTALLDDVKARILQKQVIANTALDTINGASTREQIVAADKTARKQLSDLETGAGGASDTVYDDKGVGHRYKGTGDRSDPKNYEAVK